MAVQQGPWKAGGRPQPFEPFSPAKWHDREPPPYDWLVDGCFLRGTVAMLSGDGGLGKSMLMQQLCTAIAIGEPWLGLQTKRCKSFAFFCEDDEDELHRRQSSINEHYGCQMPDLEDVLYISRHGQENVLMDFDRRTDHALPTPVFDQLCHSVKDFGAQLVILDTVADIFGGNEIVKNQVRRFITALRKLAVEIQGVIIICAHPSVAGMNTGTGISGNTAWNNSVRSRLYLTRKEGEEGQDSNERLLKTMKNNHGPFGGKIGLCWERGVFRLLDEVGSSAPRGAVGAIEIENIILKAVSYAIENGDRIAAGRQANNNIARTIGKLPSCRQLSAQDIFTAADRMIEKKRLVRVTVGGRGREVMLLRTPGTSYPGEVPVEEG